MDFTEELKEAGELERSVAKSLDAAVQSLMVLRNNQNLKEVFSLVPAFKNSLS